jgi:phosphate transport system protein
MLMPSLGRLWDRAGSSRDPHAAHPTPGPKLRLVTMPDSPNNSNATPPTPTTPAPGDGPAPRLRVAEPIDPTLSREIGLLKQRLVSEASFAIGMIESAVDALFRLDVDAARNVVQRDDEIDREEVHIEEACYRLLALFQPFARDFRTITTLLKINADLERVGDHATSLAKATVKLNALGMTQMPVALQELGQRVPMMCHALLRALQSEDAEAARGIFARDLAIDTLEKRLFDECVDLMTASRESKAAALICYRCGRELERVGDLMTNIAEDVLYLATGSIVRHEEKKRIKAQHRAG